MLNAMALVFNRAGASFQSNVDASLAVRVIEGFVSQDAIICAELAARGIDGPRHWLTGVFGYFQLFCKGRRDEEMIAGELGGRWMLRDFGYKTRPQCGGTISSTDAILAMLEKEHFTADEVERIEIRMAHESVCSLVGHSFVPGDNPQVSGQFNVRYCVANAIVRGAPELAHFSNEAVLDPQVGKLSQRIETRVAPDLMEGKAEFSGRVEIDVVLRDGRLLRGGVDGPSGFNPNPKTEEHNWSDFQKHIAYGGKPLDPANVERLVDSIARLEDLDDVRVLIPLLVSPELVN